MTASPLPPVPPLLEALRNVREILYRARRRGSDVREIETAIERINDALDRQGKERSDGEPRQP